MLNRKKIKTDLCVIGGGMAGICAAISAARQGIKVVLMHERPMLGGNASSEIRMWVCGAATGTSIDTAETKDCRETGIIEEIELENLYRNPTKNYYIWDSVLYDFVLREKNITLLLNCTCMDAETEKGEFSDGRTVNIVRATGYQMTTETFFDVYADYYADCSGDSILAPLTDAEFMTGRESKYEFGEPTYVETHDNMAMGLSCLILGRETDRKIKFTPPDWAKKFKAEDFERKNINIYSSNENFWYLELGGDRDTIHDTEEVARNLIPLALGAWDYVKNSGKCNADNWELDFLGFLPAKRESRRMTGEYIVSAVDIINNKKYDDVIAFGGWPIDDHYPAGFFKSGEQNRNIAVHKPYGIPYRCLYSKNVQNLFFAGRNISATHMAMSSLRVMATCSVLGEAVGTAAAVAEKFSLSPHGVYKQKIKLLQKLLTDNDCLLPGVTRKVSDLCRNTYLLGGNDSMKNGIDRQHLMYGGTPCKTAVKNGTPLEYKFQKAEFINRIHITFNSDLDRETLPGDRTENTHSMGASTRLDSPQFYVPKTLCREFCLTVDSENGTKVLYDTDCNLKRSYNFDVCDKVTSVKLVIKSNWGDSAETEVYSFDFN